MAADFEDQTHVNIDDLEKQIMIAKYCFLRVNQHHYNLLPFGKVRTRLIDGGSNMYKIEDIAGLQNWLQEKKLPNYENKEDMTT